MSSPHLLQCHPDTPAPHVETLEVRHELAEGGRLWLRYHLAVPLDDLAIPSPADEERADGLWKTTCFELFVRRAGEAGYIEYNLSPSSQWAAYVFDRYREGSCNLTGAMFPDIALDASDTHLALEADVVLPPPYRNVALEVAFTAVVEMTDGTKSYWSLRHPPGAPDFHHADCFAETLEAPNAP